MAMTVLFVVFCLLLGAFAAAAARRPGLLPAIGTHLKEARPKQFSPKHALFIFGPSAGHPACRLQRRLIKPALDSLLKEGVAVMEVYGNDIPLKNGEAMDWLDASLLRHALNVDGGFQLVYVDGTGKAALRSSAPILAADLADRTGLDIPLVLTPRRRSSVLKRLSAA
jgi:hypothetical protein